MSSDEEPNTTHLASGAAVGSVLGAAVSYLSTGSSLPDMIGGGTPEMKVGLPAF